MACCSSTSTCACFLSGDNTTIRITGAGTLAQPFVATALVAGPTGATGPAGPAGPAFANGFLRSATTIATMDPFAASATVSLPNQTLVLTFFTAPISETTTKIRYGVNTAETAATFSGIGLYSVDALDNLSLIASITGNTLFVATGSQSVSWTASASVTAGQRLALGCLSVTAGTTPILDGRGFDAVGLPGEFATVPHLLATVTGQSTLPSSVAVGSLATSVSAVLGILA